MSVTAWRRVLLALCVFALVQGFVAWWISANLVGTTGIHIANAQRPFSWTISVVPGSAAYAQGLRTGDVVDARAFTPADRYRLWAGAPLAGQRLVIPRVKDGRIQQIPVVAAPRGSLQWWGIAGWLGSTWAILCATLLAWRRADSAEARVLVLVIVLPNLGIDLFTGNWTTASAFCDAVTDALGLALSGSWALLATYAMLFAPQPGRLRRASARLSYAAAAVVAGMSVVLVAGAYSGTLDPAYAIAKQAVGGIAISIVVFPSLCLLATFFESRGADRERLGWVTASLAVFFVPSLGVGLATAFAPAWQLPMLIVANVGDFLSPLGLTYAMLNRRLLGLGFVINRAAVYAVVSFVVVGVFVLLEWGFTELFKEARHVPNLLVSAGLALALGLSVRAIHYRVELALDSVFFRKRHEDEKALRRFALEAPYVTEAAKLIERTTQCLERHADASFVTIAIDNDHGRWGDVNENDPALVTLRSAHKVVDLHTVETDLNGEFAYPMVARGRVLGALILGPKRSGASYAPDESAAIEQVAAGAAGALDVLALSDERSNDAVLRGLREIQESLRTLGERIAPEAHPG